MTKFSKMSTKNMIPKYDAFEQTTSIPCWETKYQLLLVECLNGNNNFDLSLKLNMYLIHFMGEFVKYAKKIVKEIIDDLFEKTKKFALTNYKDQSDRKIENYFTYEDEKNKTSIKISWCESKTIERYLHEHLYYDEEHLKLIGKGIYYINCIFFSSLNKLEFNALDLLTNVVYYLKKNRSVANILIPLSCVVSYKVFK